MNTGLGPGVEDQGRVHQGFVVDVLVHLGGLGSLSSRIRQRPKVSVSRMVTDWYSDLPE